MVTPSDDPVSSAVEGLASATFRLGIDGIKKLIDKFKNKKIAFVQDEATLEKVKEDLKSNELKFYKAYIKTPDLLTPILMGLTLRRLEEEKDFDRLAKLKTKIVSKYDIGGLHISQAVQNGIISKYITYLIEIHATESIMQKRLTIFLEDVENHICFVKNYIDAKNEAMKIVTKINVNSPDVFVISGMGNATEGSNKVIEEVDKFHLKDYYREDYSRPLRRIAFFHKIMSRS